MRLACGVTRHHESKADSPIGVVRLVAPDDTVLGRVEPTDADRSGLMDASRRRPAVVSVASLFREELEMLDRTR